jgi:rubrerythrin
MTTKPEDDAPPTAPGDGEGVDADAPENWSDERRRAFRLAVDLRRARQARAGRGFAVIVIALVAAGVAFKAPESWWVPAVGATALLGMLFRLVNWKCPNCGERLPTRGGLDHCPGCGAPLD